MWNIKIKWNRAAGSQRGHPRLRCNIGIWNVVRIIVLIWSHQSGNITVNIVKHWNVLMYYWTDTWDGEISLYSVPRGGGEICIFYCLTLSLLFCHSHNYLFQLSAFFTPVLYIFMFPVKKWQASSVWEEPACGPVLLGWPGTSSPLSAAPRRQPSSSSSKGSVIVTLPASVLSPGCVWHLRAFASANLCMKIKRAPGINPPPSVSSLI